MTGLPVVLHSSLVEWPQVMSLVASNFCTKEGGSGRRGLKWLEQEEDCYVSLRSEVGVAEEGRDPFMHVDSEVSTFDKESGGTVYSAGVVGHLARVLGRVSGFDSVKLQGARRGIFSYEI